MLHYSNNALVDFSVYVLNSLLSNEVEAAQARKNLDALLQLHSAIFDLIESAAGNPKPYRLLHSAFSPTQRPSVADPVSPAPRPQGPWVLNARPCANGSTTDWCRAWLRPDTPSGVAAESL